MSKVIFGLGNSGAEYAGTRHNVGAMLLAKLSDGFGGRFAKNKFARALVSKVQICSQEVHLAFCEGFMNNSGDGVAKTLAFFRADPSQAVVIYDDITIEPGRIKLSVGGSSGGHNGVASVMDRIGNDFARIRVGIGSKPFKQMPLADYVLAKIPPQDALLIDQIDICAVVEAIVGQGMAKAQNRFNAAPKKRAAAQEPVTALEDSLDRAARDSEDSQLRH